MTWILELSEFAVLFCAELWISVLRNKAVTNKITRKEVGRSTLLRILFRLRFTSGHV